MVHETYLIIVALFPFYLLLVVFEKLLYEQLYDYFVSNNLLSDRQFGFRQFHSTASTLLDSTNEWFINMDRCKINIAVFLAFDTINHDILLKKLETINDLPGSLEFPSARMFADDTTLTASGESVLDAEVAINHDLANIKQ